MQQNILFTLYERGGEIMFCLGALSLIVLTMILRKIIQFARLGIFSEHRMEDIKTYLSDGRIAELIQFLKEETSPLARIIECAIAVKRNANLTHDQRLQAIDATASSFFRTLESNLRAIELSANISPLLGLLGTVLGMVRAFSRIEQSGTRVDPSMLAGGIWEALMTTIAGLIIAIPALIAFTLIDSALEKYRSRVKEVVYLILSSTRV